jgi:hypothetical protein
MTGAILPARHARQLDASAVEAAAASDLVDARIGAGEDHERCESNDECDEDQSEHGLMMRQEFDQHQSGISGS